jgi:CYTH domain-containing protein/CHAD domain-containing protein
MSSEIERKFLLSEAPAWLSEFDSVRIEQGYLAIEEEVEIRLRHSGEKRLLTAKRGHGEVREEIEIALDREHFDSLWPLTESRRLTKIRHFIPIADGLIAEVDVFAGALEGLVTGEVEFDSEGQSEVFEPPAWMGAEVTGDGRFTGQRLAIRGRPSGEGIRSYRLKRKEPPSEGIRRIALGRGQEAIEGLRDARNRSDLATSVHGVRKDLKKLRAVLRLIREELGEEVYRTENQRYRNAGRELGRSRDSEVKTLTLSALCERRDEKLPADLAEAWLLVLERERDEIVEQTSNSGAESLVAQIEAGLEQIPNWQLENDSWELVEAGLVHSYRRGRQAMKRTRSDPTAENVHEWRKRTKDLWYQLRILRGPWPAVISATAAEAHELAELLGDHHDLTVLAEDLAARKITGDRDAAREVIDHRQAELLICALQVGKRLFAEKPKAFGSRFGSYWMAWR